MLSFRSALLGLLIPAYLALSIPVATAAPVLGLPVDGSPGLSADARYVVFPSVATTLTSGDTNLASDIFVYDIQTAKYIRVSVRGAGTQANGASRAAAISGDGSRIAFTSDATNLDPPITTAFTEAFLRDTTTSTTMRLSVATDGSRADGPSSGPLISRDGRFAGFTSRAANLVAGDTNAVRDGFVRDLQAGATTRETVGPDGQEANDASALDAISADGRFITYTSYATNLGVDSGGVPQIFRRDRDTGTVLLVSGDGGQPGDDWSMGSQVSADGRFVAFTSNASNLVAGDTNNVTDVFVRDMAAGTTARVSVRPDGSQLNDDSVLAGVSADGRFVCFSSHANGLLPLDGNDHWDVYLTDRTTGRVHLVSKGPDGTVGNGTSGLYGAAITPDGSYVAFQTAATNLTPSLPTGGIAVVGGISYSTLSFGWEDVTRALKLASGDTAASAGDTARYDLVPEGGDGTVTLSDAARIVRLTTGLDD